MLWLKSRTMERTLTLALISLCAALCLGQGFGSRCDSELYQDEEFYIKTGYWSISSPSARHCQLICTQYPRCRFFSFQTPSRPSKKYSCNMSQGLGTIQRKKNIGVISGFSLRDCPQSKKPCFDGVYNEAAFINKPYSTLQTNSHKECREKCREDQSCYFYTYYKSRFECELKFFLSFPRPAFIRRKNVISGFSDNVNMDFGYGEVCPSELHVDLQLGDGKYSLLFDVFSVEHCQALCNIHPQCKIFYYTRTKYNTRQCRMKSSENSQTISVKKPGVTSGRAQKGCKVDFSWMDDTFEGLSAGLELSGDTKPDLKSCQESCNKNPNCLFYSYYTKDYNSYRRMRCSLMRSFTLPMAYTVFKSDAVSGFGMKCSVWKCRLPKE